MKFFNALVAASAWSQFAAAVAVPDTKDISVLYERSTHEDTAPEGLWKRKGGGGGGGRGGGSSSGGSSSSGGRSGSSSGSSSSSAGKGSSSSSTGGRTTTGSGPSPAYGGGAYYGGGSATPYRSGSRSPSGLVPGLLLGSALGFWGAAWLHGAYAYPYTHPYYFHNATTDKNETKPVTCLCDPTVECGCDDNGNQTYFDSVIGDGSYNQLNKTLVTVAEVNGTDTIYINGTLPNGTTASGGSENPNAAQAVYGAGGWVPLASTVFALLYFI